MLLSSCYGPSFYYRFMPMNMNMRLHIYAISSFASLSSDTSITSAPEKDERKPYINNVLAFHCHVVLISPKERCPFVHLSSSSYGLFHPPMAPTPRLIRPRSCVCRFCDLFDVWNVLIFNQRPLEGSLGRNSLVAWRHKAAFRMTCNIEGQSCHVHIVFLIL